MKKQPRAPAHLSAESKRLWKAVLEDFPDIEDRCHLKVLEIALDSLDRATKCRKTIDKLGELVFDRWKQPKPNPLLAAERDARNQFLQSVKVLGLDPNKLEM